MISYVNYVINCYFGNSFTKKQKQLMVGLTFSQTELIHTSSASFIAKFRRY